MATAAPPSWSRMLAAVVARTTVTSWPFRGWETFLSPRLAALYTGGQGWLVSQLHALISFATRCADSIAPCIHPFHRDVCSPAKKIRPSLRALTGIQFSSPGPNYRHPHNGATAHAGEFGRIGTYHRVSAS